MWAIISTQVYRCNAHAPMWLSVQGSLPLPAAQTTAMGCAHWAGNTCYWNTSSLYTALITNCGSYYVYKLGSAPQCYLRWCVQSSYC
jgi:hypothetical protein